MSRHIGPCLCGAPDCPSCGAAQGTFCGYCYRCGRPMYSGVVGGYDLDRNPICDECAIDLGEDEVYRP